MDNEGKGTIFVNITREDINRNYSVRTSSGILLIFLFFQITNRQQVLDIISNDYAIPLTVSGKSRDEIGEMMGHSASQVTEHIWRVWIWIKNGKSMKVYFRNLTKLTIGNGDNRCVLSSI